MTAQNDPTVQAAGHLAQMCKLDAHSEVGLPVVIRGDFGDDATGDVVVFMAAPCRLRILSFWIENHGANAANANLIQLCAGAAGANTISNAVSLNAVTDGTLVQCGTIDDVDADIPRGSPLYIRQTKIGGVMGGICWIIAVPLTEPV